MIEFMFTSRMMKMVTVLDLVPLLANLKNLFSSQG